MKKNIVVIGGGLIGILSAILLKKLNNEVYIIEQKKKLGGLFLSRKLFKNLYFDYGSHFLKETGIKVLDKIIFNKSNSKKFHILGNLKGGCYFRNKLCDVSPFVDTKLLPRKIYSAGIKEILSKKTYFKEEKNLEAQIKNKFGKVFFKSIFEPIIKTKTFNCSLNKLGLDVHNYFGLGRIKAFSPETSREIKKKTYFNNVFSYHYYFEGESKINSYYPKKGGAGKIISFLEKILISKKIKILKNTKINDVHFNSGKINSVLTDNKRLIKCQKLVWTLNPNIMFKILNFKEKKIKTKEKKFYVSLHHIVFDKRFIPNSEYIQCNDPQMKIYRLTLYPNIHRDYDNTEHGKKIKNKKYFHLTAETVLPEKANLVQLEKNVIKEIYKMGIVSNRSNVKFKFSEYVGLGMSLPTIDSIEENKKKLKFLNNKIKNIYFTGSQTGFSSTGQMLKNIYNKFN